MEGDGQQTGGLRARERRGELEEGNGRARWRDYRGAWGGDKWRCLESPSASGAVSEGGLTSQKAEAEYMPVFISLLISGNRAW